MPSRSSAATRLACIGVARRFTNANGRGCDSRCCQFFTRLLRAIVQGLAQHGRGLRRIGDLRRDGVNRVGINAICKESTVAIEDLAALGRRRHGAHLLPLGARHKLVVLNHLQDDEPRFDAGHPQYERAGRHHETALEHRAPVGIGLDHV